MTTTMDTTAPLQWTVRLWHHQPQKLAVLIVVALLAGVLGVLTFRHAIGGVLGVAMILGATTDFWLPQRFTLDGTGATLRCGISVTSIRWEEVKRVEEEPGGFKISPLENPNSRLEPFRGVRLRVENNREQVLEAIKEWWGHDIRTLG